MEGARTIVILVVPKEAKTKMMNQVKRHRLKNLTRKVEENATLTSNLLRESIECESKNAKQKRNTKRSVSRGVVSSVEMMAQDRVRSLHLGVQVQMEVSTITREGNSVEETISNRTC